MSGRKKSSSSGAAKLTVMGLAALGVAVLLSPRYGKPLREDLNKAGARARRELAKKVALSKRLSRAAYEELATSVLEPYQEGRGVSKKDFELLKQHLLQRWDDILAAQRVKKSQKSST